MELPVSPVQSQSVLVQCTRSQDPVRQHNRSSSHPSSVRHQVIPSGAPARSRVRAHYLHSPTTTSRVRSQLSRPHAVLDFACAVPTRFILASLILSHPLTYTSPFPATTFVLGKLLTFHTSTKTSTPPLIRIDFPYSRIPSLLLGLHSSHWIHTTPLLYSLCFDIIHPPTLIRGLYPFLTLRLSALADFLAFKVVTTAGN